MNNDGVIVAAIKAASPIVIGDIDSASDHATWNRTIDAIGGRHLDNDVFAYTREEVHDPILAYCCGPTHEAIRVVREEFLW